MSNTLAEKLDTDNKNSDNDAIVVNKAGFDNNTERIGKEKLYDLQLASALPRHTLTSCLHIFAGSALNRQFYILGFGE